MDWEIGLALWDAGFDGRSKTLTQIRLHMAYVAGANVRELDSHSRSPTEAY